MYRTTLQDKHNPLEEVCLQNDEENGQVDLNIYIYICHVGSYKRHNDSLGQVGLIWKHNHYIYPVRVNAKVQDRNLDFSLNFGWVQELQKHSFK